MRSDPAGRPASQAAWMQRTVRVSRGHWHREEPGARSAGWWESVTVTWSPAAGAERRPSVPARALAAAIDMIAPVAAELVAAGTRRLLERPYRAVPGRRALRALPRSRPDA